MAIVYRYIKGSNLTPDELDGNFETVVAMVNAKAAQGVGIASATLIPPNQLQFQLTDHSYLPPITLPTATFRFVGVWQPSTPYLVNDIFSEGPNGYIVLVQHTSATTFDPHATDGSGHNLYGVFFASTEVVPAGGVSGSVLTKHSSADYDLIWDEPTLAGLSDVSTTPPAIGQIVYWNGSKFSYKAESGGGGATALTDLTDVNGSTAQVDDHVLTFKADVGAWINRPKLGYQNWNTTSRTLALDDISTYLDCTATSAATLTVPAIATVPFPIGNAGVVFYVHQRNASGPVTAVGASGVTLIPPPGRLAQTRVVGSVLRIMQTFTTNSWLVDGDLAYDASINVLATSGTASLDPTASDCDVYTVTPAGALTINAASAPAGKRISVVVTTSGTTSYTLTFGTHFKSQGTLATGTTTAKVFTVSFIGDGTNFNEVSRTAAM